MTAYPKCALGAAWFPQSIPSHTLVDNHNTSGDSCPDLLSTISLCPLFSFEHSPVGFVSPMPLKWLHLAKSQDQFLVFLILDL